MSNINVSIDTEQVSKQTDVAVLCKNAEITISNQGDYDSAATILKAIKSRYKEIDEQRKEITKPLDAAKKSVMDLFNLPLKALEKAESFVKQQMISYTTEQERKAREEQARLQKLADQEAERQKKLIEAKIERAKASGKGEKVEVLEMEKENIIPISAPIIAPQINTPTGVSYRDKWSAVIVDVNLIPREYLIPNQSALDKVAQATKGTIQIAGVKFNCEKILASR
jgi:hypothetical protein